VDSSGLLLYRDRVAVDDESGEGGDKFGLSLACAMWRTESVRSHMVEGEFLDSGYFAYIEDVDLYWRSFLFGGRHFLLKAAVAFHVRGGSGGRNSPRTRFLAEKNRFLTILKNDSLKGFCADFHEILLHEFLNLFKKLRRPHLFFSWIPLFLALPKAVRWRRDIERRRLAEREEIRTRMKGGRVIERVVARVLRFFGKSRRVP